MSAISFSIPYIEGFGLNFRLDGFRIVYAAMCIFMWICSTLISKEYFGNGKNLKRYYIASALTFIGTFGVFLSDDMLTTFTFFELMSLASYAYVAHTESKQALRAAETYLAVAVIGGLVMLMGILMLNHELGTVKYQDMKAAYDSLKVKPYFSHIEPEEYVYIYEVKRRVLVAGFLILFGFGAKAGMFPLHIWLPKAHPVAPAPASALLSGILTKTGIFGILILTTGILGESFTFGFTVLILGVVTMLTGAVLAVFSVDLKRTLACSSVSQIGFILTGVGLIPLLGEECTLAVSGAMLYMINHSLFKLTLFLCAAAIYMKCHMLNLNDLRGYGRNMPILKVMFIIGALGISGVPLLSGYISKTLIHEGIVEYIAQAGSLGGLIKAIEILFLISGGMTFSYMMKLFHAIFVDEPEEECKYAGKDKRISTLSYAAIAAPAALIVIFGMIPKLFISKLAVFMGNLNNFGFNSEQTEILENIRIFSLENLKGSMISLALGTVFFILIRIFLTEGDKKKAPVYLDKWPAKLDLEELVYRPLLCKAFPFIFRTAGKFIAVNLPKSVWKGIMVTGKNIGRFISTTLISGAWKIIISVGGFVARVFANTVNNIVEFLKRNIFTDKGRKNRGFFDGIKKWYSKTADNVGILSASISFGLILICLGLCVTLFYLLYLLLA